MKTIHKYTIPIQEVSVMEMPKGFDVIECSEQNGFACVWAIVDTEAQKANVEFLMYKNRARNKT